MEGLRRSRNVLKNNSVSRTQPPSSSIAGPDWRANSTIGRATRLILINLGQAWPGGNDMKGVGNPAKFGILIATKESKWPSNWDTLLKNLSGWETPIEVK